MAALGNTGVKRLVLILFGWCVAVGVSLAQDQPKAVKELIAKRDKALKRINETFMKELIKIQNEYSKNGDLENAKKVASLIADLPNSEDPLASKAKIFTLEGKWNYKIERGNFVTREFKGKYLIDEGGSRRRWRRLGDTITIDWGGGVYEKLTVTKDNPDVLKGRNWTGREIIYERIKK